MLMNRIRNARSKYRTLAIIVVVILTVGLVGAFGIGSSPSLNNSGNTSDEDAAQTQINALLKTIENEKADTAEKGYTENNQIAEDLYKLAGLYGSIGDSENMYAYAKEAAEYFQAAWDTAPAGLNAVGQAQILYHKAAAVYLAGDTDTAKSILDEALVIDPLNWDVNMQYANIIYAEGLIGGGTPDYQGALDYLQNYRNQLPDDNENIAELESYISSLTSSIENADSQTDTDGDATDTTGETTSDNSGE